MILNHGGVTHPCDMIPHEVCKNSLITHIKEEEEDDDDECI